MKSANEPTTNIQTIVNIAIPHNRRNGHVRTSHWSDIRYRQGAGDQVRAPVVPVALRGVSRQLFVGLRVLPDGLGAAALNVKNRIRGL